MGPHRPAVASIGSTTPRNNPFPVLWSSTASTTPLRPANLVSAPHLGLSVQHVVADHGHHVPQLLARCGWQHLQQRGQLQGKGGLSYKGLGEQGGSMNGAVRRSANVAPHVAPHASQLQVDQPLTGPPSPPLSCSQVPGIHSFPPCPPAPPPILSPKPTS